MPCKNYIWEVKEPQYSTHQCFCGIPKICTFFVIPHGQLVFDVVNLTKTWEPWLKKTQRKTRRPTHKPDLRESRLQTAFILSVNGIQCNIFFATKEKNVKKGRIDMHRNNHLCFYCLKSDEWWMTTENCNDGFDICTKSNGTSKLKYYLIKPKIVTFSLWTSLSPIKIGGKKVSLNSNGSRERREWNERSERCEMHQFVITYFAISSWAAWSPPNHVYSTL